MIPARCTHICSLLVQDCRSRRRLCKKETVWSQTVTLNNMLFSWFRNKYLLKKYGSLLCVEKYTVYEESPNIFGLLCMVMYISSTMKTS